MAKHFQSSVIKRVLLAIFSLLCLNINNADAQCLWEADLLAPAFTAAVTFSSNLTRDSPEECKETCTRLQYLYAAVEESSYCLCANDISTLGAATSCSSTCSDASECGGPDGLTVFELPVLTGFIEMVFAVDVTTVEVATPLTVTVNASADYYIDWGDGTMPVLADTENTYTLPGSYLATAFLKDLPFIRTSLKIVVHEAPTASLECPDVLELYVPLECNVTVPSQGRDYALSWHTKNATDYNTFTSNIPGESLQLFGSSEAAATGTSTAAMEQLVILANSKVDNDGLLVRVTAHSAVPGSIGIYAITPVCSSDVYCGATETCTASCPVPNNPLVCADSFCTSRSTCQASNCPPGSAPSSADYTFVLLTTVEITATDYNEFVVEPSTWIPRGVELAVGCVGTDCAGALAGVSTRDLGGGETGDRLMDTSSANSITQLSSRLMLQLILRGNNNLDYNVVLLCESAAPVPMADVPAPFDATTEQYVFQGALEMEFTITSTVFSASPATWTKTLLCQQPILEPVLETDVWMEFGKPFPFTVTFSQGSPLFSIIDTDETILFDYKDNALGGWDLLFNLEYAAEGLHFMTGNTSNVLSQVLYNATIHVVPPVTDTWTLEITCPCLDFEGGFPFLFSFPSAANPPWNGTFNTKYGDAATPLFPEEVLDFETFGNNGAAKALEESRTAVILQTGEYVVSVHLKNEVSETIVNTTILVEEAIRDVSVDMFWDNDGVIFEGMGPDKNIFMANRTTFLYPKARTGIPDQWRIYINETGETLFASSFENFTKFFEEEQDLTLMVSGYNVVQGWVNSPQIPIKIVFRIIGFHLIDDLKITKPGEEKTVVADFTAFIPLGCVMVDYGDNSQQEAFGNEETCTNRFPDLAYKGPRTAPIPMTHIYETENVYKVTAVAFDHEGSYQEQMEVVVSDLDCTMPNVTIVNGGRYPVSGTEFMMSLSFIQEATESIKCNNTYTVTRWWNISEVDPQSGVSIADVTVENVLSSYATTKINIPPRFLTYGTFRFTHYMNVKPDEKDFSLKRSDFTYVKIIPSPLKAVLVAGSPYSLKRGFGQMLSLYPGSLSYDPDYPEDKILNITLWCRQLAPIEDLLPTEADGTFVKTEPQMIPGPESALGSTEGGCFGMGPGTVQLPESNNLELNTASFSELTGKFEFLVEVEKDGRIANTILIVEIVKYPPPTMEIGCNEDICRPISYGLLINPTKRFALLGACTAFCSNELTYAWTITSRVGAPLDESSVDCGDETSSDGGIVVNASPTDCYETFITSKSDQDLAINPTFFENNKNIDEFIFELAGTNDIGLVGFTQIIVKVNKPPQNGQCELATTVGNSAISVFPSTCTNWVDPEDHMISSYSYYYIDPETNQRKSIAPTSKASLDLIMPIGDYNIFVDVSDTHGASTTFPLGNITVGSNASLEEAMKDIQYLSDIGDSTSLAMALVALGSLRDHPDSGFALDAESVANLTKEELLDRIAKVATMNNDQLEMLRGTSTFTTVDDLNSGSGVLQSMLQGVLDNPLYAYTVDMKMKENSLGFIEHMTAKIPEIDIASPYELEPFVANSLDAMSALIVSINEVLAKEEIAPPTDVAAATDWDYDVDLPLNEDPNMVIPTDEGEMIEQNVFDTTRTKSSGQIDRIFAVVDDIAKEIKDLCVPGEIVKVNTANGASMVVAKIREFVLQKGFTINIQANMNASIKFPPKFCPSHYPIPLTDCNQILGMSNVIWPCITHIFPDSSQLLSNTSRVIDIKVDISHKTVDVSNESRPILIDIPRVSSSLATPIFVNASRDMHEFLPFIYHMFNITNEDSAYTIEITPLEPLGNMKMVLLIDHERQPTASKHLNRILINDLSINSNGTYSYFVGNVENGNRVGRFFVAIGILKNTRSYKPLPAEIKTDYFDSTIDVNYYFRPFTSGCYFFNKLRSGWSGSGLQVMKATPQLIKCGTKHLTPFGFGFSDIDTALDFEYIFANAGFIDNLTLYLVLIIITCLYIIMLLWAHYMDRQDIKRRGVIPLPDNDPMNKYLYELTFYTGPDKEASCDSNIMIILSGDYDETNVRMLPPAQGYLYRRFGVNSFVMATPKPLGNINYLRVFHDNNGEPPLDSWQLQMVVVRDLQRSEKYVFDTNSWLDFSRDEGKIDKTFTFTKGVDEKTLTQNLYIRANKSTNQDHMWMSMFLRPTGSRFDRKERLSVCAFFLYVGMLVSAFWYDLAEESAREGIFNLGPFSLSLEHIVIGACMLFVIYPIVLLLTIIFKRARPRKLKKCRALSSIEKQRQQHYSTDGFDEENAKLRSKVELQPGKRKPKAKDVSPVKCIPWWTRAIAWILIICSIGASIFLVWSYGIMWGEIKTVKWYSSFITSFLISILVSQWIKVAFCSVCLSTLCKTNLSTEDIDCDEELPALKEDEEWLNQKPLDPSKRAKVHRVEGVDISNPEIDVIRTRMQKEREISYVLRGIVVYCCFLVIILVLINGRTDYNGFLLQDHLKKTFIKENHLVFDYSSLIKTSSDWWYWAKEVILQELRAQRAYNGDPPYGLRGFMADRMNRMMGYAIIRQIRSRRNNCRPPSPMDQMIKHCSGSRGIINEDSADYCAGWTVNETFSGSCENWPEFHYKTSQELQTYTYTGRLGMYSGGGYVLRLSGTQNDLINRMDELQKSQWIDQNTRAVLLEFSIYNANVNLFSICNVVAEFNEGGGIIPRWRFEPLKLIKDTGIQGMITTACEIFFVFYIIITTLRELWNMKKEKCNYFSSYWNIAEICILLISYATVGIYIYRTILTNEAIRVFNVTKGNGYVRMDSAAFMDQIYLYAAALIMFFSTLKLIKLLQFNKRMDVLSLTIRKCWDELKVFFIAFGIVFFSFACLFFFMFTAAIEDFAQILPAIQTSFKMMMGKFDFEEMKQENALSPLLFFVFSLANSMILVNIMLTIILQAFNEVKLDLEKRENKLNVIDHVWTSVKRALRMESLPKIHVNPRLTDKLDKHPDADIDLPSNDLPDKVGQLLQYINEVYFDGRLDLNDPEAKKKMMQGSVPSDLLPYKDPATYGKRTIVNSDE